MGGINTYDRPTGGIYCEDTIGCVVEKREPFVGPDMTGPQLNVRPAEVIYPKQAPDPIRYGDTPARPARWPIAIFQSVAAILSVSEERFKADLWAPVHVASTSERLSDTWAVNRWGERVNIAQPEHTPYGSRVELSTEDSLQLLIGR